LVLGSSSSNERPDPPLVFHRLLRACSEWPHGHAASQRHEFTAPHKALRKPYDEAKTI